MKRLVIIGANGQLGSDLVKIFSKKNWQVIGLTHKQIEIKSKLSITRALNRFKPQLVINTAACHDLLACEKNPQEALAVNALGMLFLAKEACKRNIVLVHFSTDYVFGGNKKRTTPYNEASKPWPQSVYAISKLAGENIIRAYAQKYFLIRVSGLFGALGSSVKGGNFVDKRIEQAKKNQTIYMVKDQVLSPTYTNNLAVNVEKLVRTTKYGTYHMVSHGYCSWLHFTLEILKLTGLSTKVIPITTDDKQAGVVRPRFSALNNSALDKIGLDKMYHWRKNLKLYLKEKGYV